MITSSYAYFFEKCYNNLTLFVQLTLKQQRRYEDEKKKQNHKQITNLAVRQRGNKRSSNIYRWMEGNNRSEKLCNKETMKQQ